MTTLKKLLVASGTVFVVLGAAGVAQAATLDFEGLPFSSAIGGSNVIPNPSSVLTDNFKSDGVIFGRAGVSTGVAVFRDTLAPSSGLNSVVGLDASGRIPSVRVGDIFFNFVVPGTLTPAQTNFVSFTIGDSGGDLDIFEIRSYDLTNNLIDTQNLSNTSRFPVTIANLGINRIEVDFTGDFGYSLDDLTFNTPTSVLEPSSTLGIVAFGLWSVGKLSKRKQK